MRAGLTHEERRLLFGALQHRERSCASLCRRAVERGATLRWFEVAS